MERSTASRPAATPDGDKSGQQSCRARRYRWAGLCAGLCAEITGYRLGSSCAGDDGPGADRQELKPRRQRGFAVGRVGVSGVWFVSGCDVNASASALLRFL